MSLSVHRRACNLCEALCGLRVELDGPRIVAIKGDPEDPHSRGFLCPKALALKDLYEDPDRLRQPMRRTPQGWQPVGWDEALAEAGERLAGIQAAHGRDALGIYWGNPPTHQHGAILSMTPVFEALGTRNRYSAASIDQLPQYLVSWAMFGNLLRFPLADVDRTQFWLILGANPLASNGSISSGPDMRGRLKAILARGGQVVVVDPRRSETAALASAHLPIRPGGDVWLLLALLQVLFAEGRVRPGAAARWAQGLEQLPALVSGYTPERVEAATGLPAERIRQLAREFASAPSAVAYGRLGVCLTPQATLTHWLINLLNLLTGNLDREGGAMFSTPAFDIAGLARLLEGGGRMGRWHSRVRGLPEFASELPLATLADEMLTPGPGQIKALLLMAGNPVLSSPGGARLDAAMAQLDYCVAVDFYINESTRHAHLILPPVTVLERGNYEAAVSAVQVRNVARYSPPLMAPPAEGREDWQILNGLLDQVLRHRGPGGRLQAALLRWRNRLLPPDRLLDLALRLGPHGAWRRAPARLSLARLRAAGQTLDLGPLQPGLPGVLGTPDRRIQAVPARFREALAALRLPEPVAGADEPLLLIGRRHLRSNNSWLHNSERLVKGAERCSLLMHPADALARGLLDGQTVCLRSAQGALQVPLVLSEEMRPGVVSLPHGWGHGRPGVRLSVAAAHPGASVNDLTDPARVDLLSGNAAVNGVPVEVLPLMAAASTAPVTEAAAA